MKLTKFRDLKGNNDVDKLHRWCNGQVIYGQVKYNGVFAKYIPGDTLYTRQGKRWDVRRINSLITSLFKLRPTCYLYGELIVPDVPFQEMVGMLNVNSNRPFPDNTLFRVFDIVDCTIVNHEQWFSARVKWTEDYPNAVATLACMAKISALGFYDHAISHGHEGVVYRIDPCLPYFDSLSPHPHIVKRKRVKEIEGVVLAVNEGIGKRSKKVGAFILSLDNGRRVSVGGGRGFTDEMLAYYLLHPPIGRTMTIQYEDLSEAGIPLKPQFKSWRDE